jgi:histone deacetylase complex regulatory component SIN3
MVEQSPRSVLTFIYGIRTDVQVYEQVSALFASAPDLIGEFKQFLPDDSRDSALFNSLMIADRGYVQSNAGPKRAGAAKESTRKKRGAPGDAKPSKVSDFFDL